MPRERDVAHYGYGEYGDTVIGHERREKKGTELSGESEACNAAAATTDFPLPSGGGNE